MTSEDHTEDALIAALRSPALPAEQMGGAAAVSAMVEARAMSTPESRPGLRSRRGVAIASVTVASLGVGGLVAAGPGIFSPAADRPELAPHVTELETPELETSELGTPEVEIPEVGEPTQAPKPSESLQGSVVVGEPVVVGTLPGADGEPAAGIDGDDGDDDTSEVECAEGNHGATVSSVAKATEPGPGHGEAVSAAARSDCGKKDKTAKDDDAPSDDDATSDDDAPSDEKDKAAKSPGKAPEEPPGQAKKNKADDED